MVLKMAATVLKHVKRENLFDLLQKNISTASAQTFRITIEPENEVMSIKKKALQKLDKAFAECDQVEGTEFDDLSEDEVMEKVNGIIQEVRAENRVTS